MRKGKSMAGCLGMMKGSERECVYGNNVIDDLGGESIWRRRVV